MIIYKSKFYVYKYKYFIFLIKKIYFKKWDKSNNKSRILNINLIEIKIFDIKFKWLNLKLLIKWN